MTRRRADDRNLKPKTAQMRKQREQDAWMGDLRTVEAVLHMSTKLRGRKLHEAGLKLGIIATRPRLYCRRWAGAPPTLQECGQS